MELSPFYERFTTACNHSREPPLGGSGCRAFRDLASVFLNGAMPRCRTNSGMAKGPGAASSWGETLAQRLLACHRQAKAFQFTLTLSRLPAVVSLRYHHGLSIPIPLLDTSYNFTHFASHRFRKI